MHIIPHGGSILFYKNKILSRRRPTKVNIRIEIMKGYYKIKKTVIILQLPIKVHTRLTCLTNSHYLVHTELPQGLQDCL